MARQFQLDTETYVNADDNSKEFQFDVETYFIEEVTVGGATPKGPLGLPLYGPFRGPIG